MGVLPFARICTLLGAHGVSAEHEVLEELQHVCVLVQGCWVVRSDVLYPKGHTSPHSGVCSDVLCRARDLAVGTAWGGAVGTAWGGAVGTAWGGAVVVL